MEDQSLLALQIAFVSPISTQKKLMNVLVNRDVNLYYVIIFILEKDISNISNICVLRIKTGQKLDLQKKIRDFQLEENERIHVITSSDILSEEA